MTAQKTHFDARLVLTVYHLKLVLNEHILSQ